RARRGEAGGPRAVAPRRAALLGLARPGRGAPAVRRRPGGPGHGGRRVARRRRGGPGPRPGGPRRGALRRRPPPRGGLSPARAGEGRRALLPAVPVVASHARVGGRDLTQVTLGVRIAEVVFR